MLELHYGPDCQGRLEIRNPDYLVINTARSRICSIWYYKRQCAAKTHQFRTHLYPLAQARCWRKPFDNNDYGRKVNVCGRQSDPTRKKQYIHPSGSCKHVLRSHPMSIIPDIDDMWKTLDLRRYCGTWGDINAAHDQDVTRVCGRNNEKNKGEVLILLSCGLKSPISCWMARRSWNAGHSKSNDSPFIHD